MRRIFVVSRLAPDSKFSMEENIEFAKIACRVVTSFGHAPYAPHLFCTQFLDDTRSDERDLGIKIGHLYLRSCHELWTFRRDSEEINSTGMRQDIGMAIEYNLPIKNLIVYPLDRSGNTRIEIMDIGEVWKRIDREIRI